MIHPTDIQEGDLLDLGEGGTREIIQVTFHDRMVRLDFEGDGYVFIGLDRPVVIQRWLNS